MNAESSNRQLTTDSESLATEEPATESPNPAAAVAAAQPAAAPPPPAPRIAWWIPARAGAVLAICLFSGLRSRVAAEAKVTKVTHEAAIPVVNVVHPVADAPLQE